MEFDSKFLWTTKLLSLKAARNNAKDRYIYSGTKNAATIELIIHVS